PSALLDAARHVLRQHPARAFDVRLRGWASNTWIARQILAPIMRRQTAAKVRKAHYPAPFALIEVWRRGGGNLQRRLRLEADSVVRLAATPTAHNLVRVYFLQERLKALAGDAAHGIAHVHVIGAGVMGGDIAAWCAYRGFSVSLQDREMKIIEPALARAKTLFAKRLKTPERVAAAQARLHADPDGTQVAAADLVLEAIYENLDAKRALYAAAQPNLRANALLASNTSSIPLNELARGLECTRAFHRPALFQPRWRRCRWSRWCATRGWRRTPSSAHWPFAAPSTNCRCRCAAARDFWSTASSCRTCWKPSAR
ncbi:3-hydroxyacyl-CoA dehydrogenase NAD-binding protein, partial [mine drainage metagenome]